MDIFNFGVSVNKIVEEKMGRQEDIGYEYISDSVKWCDIEQCGGKIKGVNVWQVSKYSRYSNSKYIKKLGISMDFCLRYPKGLDPNDIEIAFQFKNLSEIADNDPLLTKMRCFVSGKNYRGVKANDWWGSDIYKLKDNKKLNEDDLVNQAADVVLKNIGLLVSD
jgi:hypothetical protein